VSRGASVAGGFAGSDTIEPEICALLPMLKYPEILEELRLLAARYERLAEHLEAVPDTPHLRRQAG
jgi:hypothetical protein